MHAHKRDVRQHGSLGHNPVSVDMRDKRAPSAWLPIEYKFKRTWNSPKRAHVTTHKHTHKYTHTHNVRLNAGTLACWHTGICSCILCYPMPVHHCAPNIRVNSETLLHNQRVNCTFVCMCVCVCLPVGMPACMPARFVVVDVDVDDGDDVVVVPETLCRMCAVACVCMWTNDAGMFDGDCSDSGTASANKRVVVGGDDGGQSNWRLTLVCAAICERNVSHIAVLGSARLAGCPIVRSIYVMYRTVIYV